LNKSNNLSKGVPSSGGSYFEKRNPSIMLKIYNSIGTTMF
jgi:hypothetical protein